MAKFKIRKKDTVLVVSGKDKGKKGEILKVYPEEGRVLVAKIGMVIKHAKPRQAEPGGIQKMESSIHVSKVMLICPKCEQPIRAKLDKLTTGERVRLCRKCSEVIL